jgi:serine/threonine protein kinase
MEAKIEFHTKYWKNVSEEGACLFYFTLLYSPTLLSSTLRAHPVPPAAKSFIKRLLSLNPDERPTAEAALNDPVSDLSVYEFPRYLAFGFGLGFVALSCLAFPCILALTLALVPSRLPSPRLAPPVDSPSFLSFASPYLASPPPLLLPSLPTPSSPSSPPSHPPLTPTPVAHNAHPLDRTRPRRGPARQLRRQGALEDRHRGRARPRAAQLGPRAQGERGERREREREREQRGVGGDQR